MTRMHAGFTGVVQHEWPRPRGWAPPQRLDALDVLTLPGVGATLAKRLRTFGIQSVRDLLFHAPRRYESAVDQVPIAKLGRRRGRSRDRGSNSQRSRAAPPGQTDARHRDRPRLERRSGQRLVLQPAVARREARRGNERAAARQARPLRLRREELRHRRGAPDGRLRTGLSGERADPVDAAARARAHGARAARAQLPRPAAGRARARAAPRRARRDPLSRSTSSRPRRRAGGSRSTSS